MSKITLKEFFEDDNFNVCHCNTKEKAIIFLRQAGEVNMKMGSNIHIELDYTAWNEFKENTCYSNRGTCASKDYYEEEYDIYEFEDIIFENEGNMKIYGVEPTKEQEKEIKKILGIKDETWKPEVGELVWILFGTNTNEYNLGFAFKTKEEAEFRKEQLLVENELRRFAAENNEEIDWNDENQPKYYISYHSISNTVSIDAKSTFKSNDVYFTSAEIAQKAIDTIGEDRIKKFYLGV